MHIGWDLLSGVSDIGSETGFPSMCMLQVLSDFCCPIQNNVKLSISGVQDPAEKHR